MYLILSILIAMGESRQFPKPESEIRFGWGMSYNYIGQMHHNLNKYDVEVGLEIPDFRVIPYYQPFSRDPNYCNKWNTGIRTKLLFETCQKIWPAYIGTISKLDNSQERIKHIMEKEIPAVVPDFKLRPAPTETTANQPNVKRVKRFITDLLSLDIQGFSAFYQNRKQNKLKKGMKKLFERQNKLENRVSRLDNDMISLAKTTLKSLDHFQKELVRQGEHIKHLTNRVKHVEMAMQHHEHQITDNRNSIKFLGNMLGVLLSDLNRYLLLYESILSELDHFMDALDNLSNNQLSHSVVSTEVMKVLIDHIQQVLERDYPDYELVVSQVHDYYNLPISTFACKNKTLVIYISFYIKPKNQEPLFLYDIRTIPVPYHMNEELIYGSESKYTYTKVKPTTRILAMGSNTQINLDYDQLVHCVKYNILFFCEQMFLAKQGNKHTCESAIYTNQNEKLIQQKCTIEYYPKLDPDPEILDAGNYILLGNLTLPWTYFCEQKDEIPTPSSGSSYVIIKKHDLCQCSLSAGSWYLEANIAYCTEDPDNPSTQLTLYYTVNMATVIYNFQEKLKTEGITDLTLFTEQIPFYAREPDLIVEEDTYVLHDTSPAVNYKEVMEDFAMRRYLSKPDLAMSMAEPSHWFGGHNSGLTFVGVAAVLVVVLIPFLLFTLYKYCGFRFQFQQVNSILAKLLILNKTVESIPPTLAQPMTEFGEMTFEMFDLKVIQLVLIVMAFSLTCYLLIRMTLWLFDYLNTKLLNINSTGLTYLNSLTMDKSNIYLQFSDFTTSECANLYLGTICGNPEDIHVCGQFVAGTISLDRKFPFDFITLKWDTKVLSLIDLDLPMPTTLQISNWQKSKIRRMFDSNSSYFRIVAHNPNNLKVRAITGAYNLHDEVLEDDMGDADILDAPQPAQPIAVVQPALEVVVTDQQHTMTFNGEQVHICEEVEV